MAKRQPTISANDRGFLLEYPIVVCDEWEHRMPALTGWVRSKRTSIDAIRVEKGETMN